MAGNTSKEVAADAKETYSKSETTLFYIFIYNYYSTRNKMDAHCILLFEKLFDIHEKRAVSL